MRDTCIPTLYKFIKSLLNKCNKNGKNRIRFD